jgi:hypothetical protein
VSSNKNKMSTNEAMNDKQPSDDGVKGYNNNSNSDVVYFVPVGGSGLVDISSGGGGGSGAWRAIGRFIGKAIIDRQLVPGLHLSRPLLKQLLGQSVGLKDLLGLDDALYKSLLWTLNNSIEGVLDETFTVLSNGEEMELCEGGRNTKVTDVNKHKYVELRVSWYFKFRYVEELDSFTSGFADLISPGLLAPFDTTELVREKVYLSLYIYIFIKI